jgi:hypothetical protein
MFDCFERVERADVSDSTGFLALNLSSPSRESGGALLQI